MRESPKVIPPSVTWVSRPKHTRDPLPETLKRGRKGARGQGRLYKPCTRRRQEELGLGSRSESAFPSRGGSPPPVEVPFGLPWWRTKLSNTQPCRWCPFPPSTLTSANSKQLLFSNPFLLLNEGQRAASSLSRRSLVLPKPLKKKNIFCEGVPPRLSTPVSPPPSLPPLLCFFTRRKERTEEQKRAQV